MNWFFNIKVKGNTDFHNDLELVFKKEVNNSFIFKQVFILNLQTTTLKKITELGMLNDMLEYTYQEFLNQPF